jgi:regulator of sigma E protease
MVFTILIAIFSLGILIFLHELGHFILAKKFGVKVEEFGIGFPPRIFSKKIGETIYSLNILPFGGFVKLLGENAISNDPQSFSAKPVGKRALIVLGGIFSFWILALIFLTIAGMLGVPTVVTDTKNLSDLKVQIVSILPGSPAEKANLKVGDIIEQIRVDNQIIKVENVQQFREIVEKNKGKEIILGIKRGQEMLNINVVPRKEVKEGEGPIGILLVNFTLKSYPLHLAFLKSFETIFSLTKNLILTIFYILSNLFQKGSLVGTEIAGPVRIVYFVALSFQMGISYYLFFIGLIATNLAFFNLLPLPGLDGGKLLFLILEKIRKKPVSPEIENKITAFFIFILLFLALIVMINDLKNLL